MVHRHEARRLHYDLRLEIGGVLKSWAVPRGFCYDPTVKRLAVRTEDHPLAYTDFFGVIPEGEYGGGTMVIWDRGRYRITEGGEGGGAHGVDAGKMVIELAGRKLRGAWHMVRTKRNSERVAAVQGPRSLRPGGERSAALSSTSKARSRGPARRLSAGGLCRPGTLPPFSDRRFLFEPALAGLPVFFRAHPSRRSAHRPRRGRGSARPARGRSAGERGARRGDASRLRHARRGRRNPNVLRPTGWRIASPATARSRSRST